MRITRNMSPIAGSTRARSDEKRNRGRVKADLLMTNLGEAVEFSETGIRVRTSRFVNLAEGQEIALVLKGPDGKVACAARVCWLRPDGLFKRLAGLQFLDESPEFRQRVRGLAHSCMDMRTFAARDAA